MKSSRLLTSTPGFILFLACLSGCANDQKFERYFSEGEQLYVKHCSNCHQKDGSGLGLVYPPLSKNDFMDQNLDQVLCLMKKGRKGAMLVNGKSYNQPMPGVPSLTELEIAEIATYIYNSWGNERGIVDVKRC